LNQIQRALISVSDKTGIVELAKELTQLGVEILSTGGTAKFLSANGIPVTLVETVTGFPELMDGRVKTLHPKIHGALLGLRDNPTHVEQAKRHGIEWIDLLVINLYPFERTIAKPNISIEEAIEQIDIGGPCMIRSGAKNYRFVAVVTDPQDYPMVLSEIRNTGGISLDTKKYLAVKAFRRTADYDSTIDQYLSQALLNEPILRLSFFNGESLRYGENSHQAGWLYRDVHCEEPSLPNGELLGGKEMSFNNYVDGDAALEAVKDLKDEIGVAVIKHTNPCGYATGETPREALERAWAGDPISAFGSVIACNAAVDLAFAEFLKGENVEHFTYTLSEGKLVAQKVPSKFVEVIIAPDFSPEALALLQKTKTLRLLKVKDFNSGKPEPYTYRKITGGILQMERDFQLLEKFEVVTEKGFDERKKRLAEFAMKAAKHTKSNAIVLAREYKPGFFQVMGMGAGQPNRVDSLRKLAVSKALENLRLEYELQGIKGSFEAYAQEQFAEMVLASDAFFPFEDTVRSAGEYGIRYIVQPGGSKRDEDSIRACNALGIAMAFTGLRHFRH